MFNVGDKVVHPMHGAGVIDSIVSERINGKTQEYYVFHMPVNGLVLKIPVCNSQLVGLRSVVDATAADTVMLALVGRVIKCLTLRDVERGLSTGERKMLHSAKQIFISEMVLATDEPYQEIESRVNASMV